MGPTTQLPLKEKEPLSFRKSVWDLPLEAASHREEYNPLPRGEGKGVPRQAEVAQRVPVG